MSLDIDSPVCQVIIRHKCCDAFELKQIKKVLFTSRSSFCTLQLLNSSEDAAEYREGAATIAVTRRQRASPPLTGTFDVESYGGRAEGTSHRYVFSSDCPGLMHADKLALIQA